MKEGMRMGRDAQSKSRDLFIVEVVCATVIGNLVGGVLLSGYLDHIGLSPKLNGIISAIPVAATVFQPLGAMLGQRSGNCKRFVVTFAVVQRLLFAGFYCIPLLLGVDVRAATAVLIFGCANGFAAFMTPSATNWLMDLTPGDLRQGYFSRREIALVATGAVMNLLMGFLIQYFTGAGAARQGYFILSCVLLLFAGINIFCLLSIQAPPSAPSAAARPPRDILLKPLRDRRFRPVILAICLYEFGAQCALPFWNIHTLSNLKLSYVYLTVLGVAVSLGKVFTLKLWMRLGGRRVWSQVCVFAFAAIGLSHLLNALAWEGMAVWYMLIPSAAGTLGWALVGMGTLNFEYDNVEGEDQAIYIGVVAVAAGVVGFLGTLLGGVIMDLVDAWGPVVAGRPVAGQQVQMVLSCILLLCAAGYLHSAVRRGVVH